jgi:DNA modification methylase
MTSTPLTTKSPANHAKSPAMVEELYAQLVQEHRKANAAWRRIGILTNELLALGQSYTQIQRRLGCAKTSLHRWAQIVQAFPNPDDSMILGKVACMSILNSCVTSARQIEGLKSARWIPTAREALALIAKSKTIPSVRKLTAALAGKRQTKLVRSEAQARSALRSTADHSFHNKDCVEVAKTLDDGCLDMAWLDPTYFYGCENNSKPALAAVSPLVLTECANSTVEESRAVLRRLIPVLSRKMNSTGLIVYWSNGRSHDDPEVVALFLKNGWRVTQASLWRKWRGGSGPAGRMRTADAPDGERYLVWAREGHTPLNYDHSLGRQGLIEDEAFRANSSAAGSSFDFAADGIIDGSGLKHRGRRHLMEKPTALAERFLRKYLPANSLIFDCFGCSGSACIAALNLGHRFIYSELNKTNFQYGSAKITAHMKQAATIRPKP